LIVAGTGVCQKTTNYPNHGKLHGGKHNETDVDLQTTMATLFVATVETGTTFPQNVSLRKRV